MNCSEGAWSHLPGLLMYKSTLFFGLSKVKQCALDHMTRGSSTESRTQAAWLSWGVPVLLHNVTASHLPPRGGKRAAWRGQNSCENTEWQQGSYKELLPRHVRRGGGSLTLSPAHQVPHSLWKLPGAFAYLIGLRRIKPTIQFISLTL